MTLIYVYFSGKAVGGRKAKENRLRIKHLTSGQYSSGFHGDLNVAVSKILTEKERFVDKSKEKRKVIKDQTNGTRTSMAKSIALGKVNCSQSASSCMELAKCPLPVVCLSIQPLILLYSFIYLTTTSFPCCPGTKWFATLLKNLP